MLLCPCTSGSPPPLRAVSVFVGGQDVRQVADTDEVVVATGNVWSDRPLTDTMSGEKAVASMVSLYPP